MAGALESKQEFREQSIRLASCAQRVHSGLETVRLTHIAKDHDLEEVLLRAPTASVASSEAAG